MPDRQQSLFRAAALAKIQSPERLDTLLPVTTPLNWLAVLLAGLALAAALLWGFTGTVMRTTTGEGILVRNAEKGIMSVGSQSSGAIQEILVSAGDVVRQNQPIFTLDVATLQEQLTNNQALLESLVRQDSLQDHEENERLKILHEKLRNQRKLYEEGILTKSPILDTQTAIAEVEARSFSRDQEILNQRARVADLQARLGQEGVVRAPFEGEILEITVNVGDYARPERTLLRFQSLEGDEEALIFVPAGEGKKVKAGMAIRVSPSTVRPEEFGYILGTVKSVTMYPVSREVMVTELSDDVMVDRLLQGGNVIAVVATLETDPSTPSGFKWSSSRGPDLEVEGGTLCTASIVLERQRPITLVIPFLRKQLGLY